MLSPETINLRKNRLTSSRVGVLMSGDAAEVLELYQIMIGERVEDDLSEVLPVQIGIATEPVNLRFFSREQHTTISRQGEVVLAFDPSYASCTLDGWADAWNLPIECKHVGGHEPFDVVLERYMPQLHWIMLCCDTQQAALSVIISNNQLRIEVIERNQQYLDELIKRADQFMACVRSRTPPVELPAVPAPGMAGKVYDMSSSNIWCDAAVNFLGNWRAAEIWEEAKALLKELTPADAKKAHGAGVAVTRDRANRLFVRPDGKGN